MYLLMLYIQPTKTVKKFHNFAGVIPCTAAQIQDETTQTRTGLRFLFIDY